MREELRAVCSCAVLIVLSTGPAWAAAANRIYIADQEVAAGATGVIVPVRIDTDAIRHGFSVGIQYDQAVISVKDVAAAGVATGAEWSFGQIFDTDGKLHWGVVLDMSNPIEKTIAIGTDQIVLDLTVDVKATTATTTAITPKDGLGTPDGGWVNILSYKGETPTHPELTAGTLTVNAVATKNKFKRGNCNGDASAGDGSIDLSDAVFLLGHLFLGGETPPCKAACDADSSASLDLTDAIFILGNLFLGGPPPIAPFPNCDEAPIDDTGAGCLTSTSCK